MISRGSLRDWLGSLQFFRRAQTLRPASESWRLLYQQCSVASARKKNWRARTCDLHSVGHGFPHGHPFRMRPRRFPYTVALDLNRAFGALAPSPAGRGWCGGCAREAPTLRVSSASRIATLLRVGRSSPPCAPRGGGRFFPTLEKNWRRATQCFYRGRGEGFPRRGRPRSAALKPSHSDRHPVGPTVDHQVDNCASCANTLE